MKPFHDGPGVVIVPVVVGASSEIVAQFLVEEGGDESIDRNADAEGSPKELAISTRRSPRVHLC